MDFDNSSVNNNNSSNSNDQPRPKVIELSGFCVARIDYEGGKQVMRFDGLMSKEEAEAMIAASPELLRVGYVMVPINVPISLDEIKKEMETAYLQRGDQLFAKWIKTISETN